MILSFFIENWMSFRDRAGLSMIATRERQHNERVPRIQKYGLKILPVSSVYGGNASGKTNLLKALNFAKTLVVKGTQPESDIPVDPFLLDAKYINKPTTFSIELLIHEYVYHFSFAVTSKLVVEETLSRISSSSERVLYDRKKGKMRFDKTLDKDQMLHFAFKGTRDNQLFLTNAVSQKIDLFKPVYEWFRDQLEFVAPDSRFAPIDQFMNEEHPLYTKMNLILAQLDTGIAHIGGEEISVEGLPETLKAMLQDVAKEGLAVRLPLEAPIIVTKKNGRLVAKKLVAYHARPDGTEAKFEVWQESDGSQRAIDLVPAFLDLSTPASDKVYVIDEIDRSLHPLLVRHLLEEYLKCCSPDSRAQLLFTTHNMLLMEQQLFRRDEMWVTERDENGACTLISFSDYKDIRYDKDIRKSYLQGRLGGIPRLPYTSCLEETGDSS